MLKWMIFSHFHDHYSRGVHTIRSTGGDNTITTSSDSDFLLSPPEQNHQLTFNATGVVVRTVGDDLPLQDMAYLVACAFVNGENTSNLISPMNLTVRLQEGICYF